MCRITESEPKGKKKNKKREWDLQGSFLSESQTITFVSVEQLLNFDNPSPIPYLLNEKNIKIYKEFKSTCASGIKAS